MGKNASDNIPAFQFYPNDWLSDVSLRTCSLSARGLWIDLICLMYRTPKIGYLVYKDGQELINFDAKMVQKLTGISRRKVTKLIQELLDKNVLRTDDNGFYFSKRIVKQHGLSKKRKAAGILGGNPKLLNQKSKQSVKQKETPSSSSSSSTSLKEKIYKKESGNLQAKTGEEKPLSKAEIIWQETLKKIEDHPLMSKEAFETWFLPMEAKLFDEKTLFIQVPNKLFANWHEDHYHEIISNALLPIEKYSFVTPNNGNGGK